MIASTAAELFCSRAGGEGIVARYKTDPSRGSRPSSIASIAGFSRAGGEGIVAPGGKQGNIADKALALADDLTQLLPNYNFELPIVWPYPQERN